MKKLQYILLALAFVLAGCNNKDSIWNVMDDMDSRIATLEVLCQEMNTNISALETLIKAQNNGDYITNITEIRNGSTIVGYTITFKNHEPVTIYNGTNGKDGHDGTDGYKPTVGAKQDTDGIYYWTVDGDWLTDANGNKIPVTGEKGDKGDKGDPGDKGQDGKDGHDGTNGVNGNTPQLKIDGGYWYISYDGGTNWTQLGKATGEDGKDGTNGTNGSDGAKGDKGDKGEKGDKGDAGDSLFSSVTQDAYFVYFTLADGTQIKIPKNSGSSSDNDGYNVSGMENGHAYVDLGLPSGTKWATCNLGSVYPAGKGYKYIWGKTTPCPASGRVSETEYPLDEVKALNDSICGTEYDAATANWGGNWRLPTKEQCQELLDYATASLTTLNDVKGIRITGANGNSIFLPFYNGSYSKIMIGQGVEGTDGYYKSGYFIWLLYGDTYTSGGVTEPKISITYHAGKTNYFYYTNGYYVRPVCK